MGKCDFLSVIIPAFNEAEIIDKTLQNIQATILKCDAVNDYEIVVVDDHSSDETFQLVSRLRIENSKIKCIRLSRRGGSHTAIRAGLNYVRGDAVLCIAADGQDDPTAIPAMLEQIKKGKDIVWALRNAREEGVLARFVSKTAYRIINFFINNSSSHVDLSHADFFMFTRNFAESIKKCPERNTSLFGLMIWLGFDQGVVYYERKSRTAGHTKWSLRAKTRLLLDWVIAFSGLPLKLISFVGFVTATAGFIYAIFIVFYSLFGYSTPGWAETAILILVLGGLQMLMLGITGEYLWRNLDETRKRPLFFVEKTTEKSNEFKEELV